jgi:hypothetical protein
MLLCEPKRQEEELRAKEAEKALRARESNYRIARFVSHEGNTTATKASQIAADGTCSPIAPHIETGDLQEGDESFADKIFREIHDFDG